MIIVNITVYKKDSIIKIIKNKRKEDNSNKYILTINDSQISEIGKPEIDDCFKNEANQIDKIINSSPIIRKFQEIIKQQANKLKDHLENIIHSNPNKDILLSIKSQEIRMLFLPWESILISGDRRISDIPNVICIRNINADINKPYLIKQQDSFLIISSFSSLEDKVLSNVQIEVSKIITSGFSNITLFSDFEENDIKIAKQKGYSIIHFTGHSDESCLTIKNGGSVNPTKLNLLIDDTKLVYLNGCNTTQQRGNEGFISDLISNARVKYIIGMQYFSEPMYAMEFATNFYSELSTCNNVIQAFKFAKNESRPKKGYSDDLYPVLYLI